MLALKLVRQSSLSFLVDWAIAFRFGFLQRIDDAGDVFPDGFAIKARGLSLFGDEAAEAVRAPGSLPGVQWRPPLLRGPGFRSQQPAGRQAWEPGWTLREK